MKGGAGQGQLLLCQLSHREDSLAVTDETEGTLGPCHLILTLTCVFPSQMLTLFTMISVSALTDNHGVRFRVSWMEMIFFPMTVTTALYL